MANLRPNFDYRPRNINMYVPGLQSHTMVDPRTHIYNAVIADGAVAVATNAQNAPTVNFVNNLTVSASVATTVNAGSFNALAGGITADGAVLACPYGRCVAFAASAANTAAVTIRGRDYLGQPMTEVLPLNGTTLVTGAKAFMWIDSVSVAGGAATTFAMGFAGRVGLPFTTAQVLSEMNTTIANGTTAVATVGTLVQPLAFGTAPANNNADVRGVYTPSTTIATTQRLSITAIADVSRFGVVDSSPDTALDRTEAEMTGGLYGVRQFFA